MSKLWGGRFSKETDKSVEAFTKSIHFDYKLAEGDVIGSQIHVAILEKAGYLTSDEAIKLFHGLDKILDDIRNKKYVFDDQCEDIHTDIQNKLQALPGIGDLVLKLHTGRSRNDQVVFATKYYSKKQIGAIGSALCELCNAIVKKGQSNKDIIIPGFTHLQHAQPVYLKDHLDAYVQMLLRDNKRLYNVFDNIKLTVGAGALAGTPIFKTEAEELIKQLSMAKKWGIEPTANSLDVVSDRDFVIEILSALSMVAMHLSRLAEDLIIWSTKEFGFIELDDAFCTGSSLMPQKKNPDVLEIIRGYAGRIYGNLINILTTMKGLPLTYNRDMQLDKEPLFNSFEIVSSELKVLKGVVETLTFNHINIEKHLKDEALYATDMVYYLIEKGIPFKTAHTIVGELINYSISENLPIKNMPEGLLKEKFCDQFIKRDVEQLFDPNRSVESKKTSIKRPDYDVLIRQAARLAEGKI